MKRGRFWFLNARVGKRRTAGRLAIRMDLR